MADDCIFCKIIAGDLPGEIVDSDERIRPIIPILDEMVSEGMVTLEKVEIIAYRGSEKKA